jgi:hypothetical protein
MKFQFSGHESFICKHFWLKKGYDFIQRGERSFGDELAVVELGVGKNMVIAINHWLKAFGVVDSDNSCTPLGNFLFHEQTGRDKYLENLGSIWLLHYSIIKTTKASTFSLFFNDFRKGKVEFTKEQFLNFILRKLDDVKVKANANTVSADITVFLRNYVKPEFKNTKIDIEDDFSNLFIDLGLMESYSAKNVEDKMVDWYVLENKNRLELPWQIVLFTILDNEQYSNSISFRELLTGYNSPGTIFALDEAGLYDKLEQITKNIRNVTYADTAGVRELQFRTKPDKWRILNDYYNG